MSNLDKDLEERKDIIIAVIVTLFFGWLIYQMDWFNTESEGLELPVASAPAVMDEKTYKYSEEIIVSEQSKPSRTDHPAPQPLQEITPSISPSVPMLADSDGDGFFDSVDPCPNTAGTSNGCPVDSDGDGVIDAQDRCPNIAGIVENKGCLLDTDEDNVPDIDDKCPSIAGSLLNKGCPEVKQQEIPFPIDTDGDALPDSVDKCPTIPGTEDGCPIDTDADGVPDSQDRCPKIAGAVENYGCLLDSDADGTADIDDKCPNVAGAKNSNGCPEVKVSATERKIINDAISSVAFISGHSQLTQYSKGLLNKVASILLKNTDYKLLIEGHTDSSGDEQLNLKLSQDRAQSTFNYLVSKGIAKTRMSHSGFGEEKPIASNKTRAGRLKNRRVEFKLFYKN